MQIGIADEAVPIFRFRGLTQQMAASILFDDNAICRSIEFHSVSPGPCLSVIIAEILSKGDCWAQFYPQRFGRSVSMATYSGFRGRKQG
jgi:hypothetical protein